MLLKKLIILFVLFMFISECATPTASKNTDKPVVNIKEIKVENAIRYDMPEAIREFIKSTPEYKEAVLLANEQLGDMEIRKRFENFGYAPYVISDLNGDGKDEYAFVVLNRHIPEMLIIKKVETDEWKEDFSMKLDVISQIKLSDPAAGIFSNPCVIVTNISLKAVHNICWDGMKYLVVNF